MRSEKLYGPLPGGLHDDPSKSYTMASRYYSDPAIYAEEQDAIFAKSWIFVGHESQVAEPGSYKTVELADESIALVRGRDGERPGVLQRLPAPGAPHPLGRGQAQTHHGLPLSRLGL